MSLLDKLYEHYNVLVDANENIANHENLYLEIIEGVKGNKNEKRLASQFICKFFKHFPTSSPKALNALFDLCEDEDVEIRKQVIRDLPSICKDLPDNVCKITNVLAQLMVTDDASELQLINLSLVSLCKISPKLFLDGLFSIIENVVTASEEIMRERSIKFLKDKMKTLPSEFWTKENEEFFLEKSRAILSNCTKEEFETFMAMLSNLKICKMISGQQVLLDIITRKAELEKGFDPADLENADRFLLCMKQATSCFSQFVCSNPYVQYVCEQILPKHKLIASEDGSLKENFELLPILQSFSEVAPYVQPDNVNLPIELVTCEKAVIEKLRQYLPEPKLPDLEASNGKTSSEDDFQFTFIEGLLFALHSFGKKAPDTFIEDIGGQESFKEFRHRLQYLALGCQSYIKRLQGPLKVNTGKDLVNTDEYKFKQTALKCIQNINTLIKDLFYPKPIFKSQILLSWKAPVLNAKNVSTKKSLKQSPAKTQNKSPIAATTQSPIAKKGLSQKEILQNRKRRFQEN